MKINTISLAALFAGICTASASFSLDFTGLEGNTLSAKDPQVIENVTEVFESEDDVYGDVDFSVLDTALETSIALVDNVPAILFDSSRTIVVNFFGDPVQDFVVQFVGVSDGATTSFALVDADPFNPGRRGEITVEGGTAAISGISFRRADKQIPEPSSALLVGLGAIALLRRRR